MIYNAGTAVNSGWVFILAGGRPPSCRFDAHRIGGRIDRYPVISIDRSQLGKSYTVRFRLGHINSESGKL